MDFRPEAKVWHLYLVEAEREAKERAELWRTGLDAVLIFVSPGTPPWPGPKTMHVLNGI